MGKLAIPMEIVFGVSRISRGSCNPLTIVVSRWVGDGVQCGGLVGGWMIRGGVGRDCGGPGGGRYELRWVVLGCENNGGGTWAMVGGAPARGRTGQYPDGRMLEQVCGGSAGHGR
jgi:hypothetical protein